MVNVTEKKHRLPLRNYCGTVRISFTICINDHFPVFVDSKIVDLFVSILSATTKKHSCVNWAYIFMPDHVHIVLEGTKECSNLWKAVVLFKQKTGYWFSKNLPRVQWQKDFYDRIHRHEDELLNHILYVINNPVRKGIVKHWREYRFKGSLDNDLDAIVWG